MKLTFVFLLILSVNCFSQDSLQIKAVLFENTAYRNKIATSSETRLLIYKQDDLSKQIIDTHFTADSTYISEVTETGGALFDGTIPVESTMEEVFFKQADFEFPDDIIIYGSWDGDKTHFDSLHSKQLSMVSEIKFRNMYRVMMENSFSPSFKLAVGDTAKLEKVFTIPFGPSGMTDIVCTYYYVLKRVHDETAYIELFLDGSAGDIRVDILEMQFGGGGEIHFDLQNQLFSLMDFTIEGNGMARMKDEMADISIKMNFGQRTILIHSSNE